MNGTIVRELTEKAYSTAALMHRAAETLAQADTPTNRATYARAIAAHESVCSALRTMRESNRTATEWNRRQKL